ncbi:MAG: indolepyruvate oxidoreductase subunit beta [Marinisporobacter sp.]|jgi:indolepyruvate ferredoxin oxidoreductase beta subunit|nr:indolepyruvate oxidoreductase subunit beta [Marinisporobacter sp.]
MAEVKNILLVGVGGQGTILASKILSTGLMEAGYDVKMSEIHGMSQRGGSVTTQVRFGEEVYSPIIGKGEADILVSFEVMEALRWLDHLKPKGKMVINEYKIPSVPILTGKQEYPKGVIDRIKEKVDTTVLNAAKIAEDLGNVRTMNIVLLGSLVKAMELEEINWEGIIQREVKEKFIDINIKALKAGMESL